MKKIFALLVAVSMIFTFAACNNSSGSETTTAPTSGETAETTLGSSETTTEPASESTTAGEIPSGQETTTTLTEQTTATASTDPSQWTDEEIIEFYKAAATKTHPTTQHQQTMTLDELVVGDGGGMVGFILKVAKPAINAVLEKNSATFDGITGGYKDLVPTDAKSLKAYKSGNYTIIEMTMKNQIDGKHGHNMSGTVGHAITVLGDVSIAVAEFPQFDIDTENADIKINYHDATVKVKINQDGIIENGTWRYTAGVDIKNLDISGIMIKKANADIGYNIVVGGGF